MKKIGVFISGGGTNLQALIDSVDSGELKAQIGLVISSREGAGGLERAKKHNIETCVIKKADFSDLEGFSNAILEELKKQKIEILVLAGYLNLIPPKVIERYKNKIINIHPSLIPAFCGRGFYGERVHKSVLEYGVKVTGATVHFVDEGADTGPIILQKPVMILPKDDIDSLSRRVLSVEHELLPKALGLLLEGRLKIEGRKVTVI